MALLACQMASISFDEKRNGYRVGFYTSHGIFRSLWLGKIRKAAAVYVKRYIEDLVEASKTATPPTPESLAWANKCSQRIRSRLEEYGLVEKQKQVDLHKFCQSYIDSRKDLKPRTILRLQTCADRMHAYFGSVDLTKITKGDADRFASELRSTMASASAGRELKRCRQFFTAAIADNLITSNPFQSVSVTAIGNKERQVYVDAKTVQKVAKHLEPEVRAVLLLARFCGLRVPSEPQALLWTDIDFKAKRLTIRSPKLEKTKTPSRDCPLFKEVILALEALQKTNKEKPFEKWPNSANRFYREHLLAACKEAGVKPWPKLWNNLRASCRTDLSKRFPSHVCNAWLGHSDDVAHESYLMVTDDFWKEATS